MAHVQSLAQELTHAMGLAKKKQKKKQKNKKTKRDTIITKKSSGLTVGIRRKADSLYSQRQWTQGGWQDTYCELLGVHKLLEKDTPTYKYIYTGSSRNESDEYPQECGFHLWPHSVGPESYVAVAVV